MPLADVSTLTGILANVANILGVPIAIIVLINDRRRARADREAQTYQALQSEYSSFLQLCLAHPDLRIHDFCEPTPPPPLTAAQTARRMVALEILVSMFESAYFLYHHGQSTSFKARQWTGWNAFMRDWAARPDFREAWAVHLGAQFDAGFIEHMDGLIRESAARAS
ncbi:MAG: hypothetical protein IPK64_12270 [bacterium]|nr:hypothetical protein [bacterium]